MLQDINRLADTVMRGVVATNVVTEANLDQAVEVMRAECKALLLGEEYKQERAALLSHSVSEQTVLASVVASCVLKIEEQSR